MFLVLEKLGAWNPGTDGDRHAHQDQLFSLFVPADGIRLSLLGSGDFGTLPLRQPSIVVA
jgi:hypothetical protein